MGALIPMDHTADMRWRIEGESLTDLLATLAEGVRGEIAEEVAPDSSGRFRVFYEGAPAEAFIRFANDLLYRLQVEGELILVESAEEEAGGWRVAGDTLSVGRITGEIKAATYNNLRLEREEERWVAEVTFDR